MIPKINIEYNKFLDPIFTAWIRSHDEWKDWIPPTKEIVDNRVDVLTNAWIKYEKKVLNAISDVTGLQYKRNEIDVYIVSGNLRTFSRPIVMKSGYSPDFFVNVLIHELIHCIYSDNKKLIGKALHYPHENHNVSVHVYLNAILKYIFIDVLNEPERLHLDISKVSKSKLGYDIAWDIVEKSNYKALIEEFKSKIK